MICHKRVYDRSSRPAPRLFFLDSILAELLAMAEAGSSPEIPRAVSSTGQNVLMSLSYSDQVSSKVRDDPGHPKSNTGRFPKAGFDISSYPAVLTIAGSDCSGGAGIQANYLRHPSYRFWSLAGFLYSG